MQPCSSTNEVRGCSVPAYAWSQSWVNISLTRVTKSYPSALGTTQITSCKLDKQVSSDRSTIDRAARTCTSSFAFTRMSSRVCDPTLTSPSHTQPRRKPSWEKTAWLASPTTDVTAVLVYEWNVWLFRAGLCLVPVLSEHHASLMNK